MTLSPYFSQHADHQRVAKVSVEILGPPPAADDGPISLAGAPAG